MARVIGFSVTFTMTVNFVMKVVLGNNQLSNTTDKNRFVRCYYATLVNFRGYFCCITLIVVIDFGYSLCFYIQ